MKSNSYQGAIGLLFQSLGMLSLAGTANAIPIDATIGDARDDGYSVVHFGDNPSGSGNRLDWLWFDPGQSLSLDLTGGIISLLGAQSFNLSSENGANSVIQILSMDLDLNDVSDGFAGGTLDYLLDDTTSGTFSFANENYSGLYNSSNFDGSLLDFYIWGGDSQNDLGFDLGVSGIVVEPDTNIVPLPGTLALAMLGMGALMRSRRNRRTARA